MPKDYPILNKYLTVAGYYYREKLKCEIDDKVEPAKPDLKSGVKMFKKGE